MKTTFFLIMVALSSPVLAQTQSTDGPKSYPLCNDKRDNFPCQYAEDEANSELPDMIIENTAGYKLIKKSPGQRNRISAGFMVNSARIILLNETHTFRTPNSSPTFHTVEQYEILLDDCRGTDQCMGSYLWTAIATTESDGYSYETKYKNKLEAVNYSQFPGVKK